LPQGLIEVRKVKVEKLKGKRDYNLGSEFSPGIFDFLSTAEELKGKSFAKYSDNKRKNASQFATILRSL
jgi:hypothetical protein